MRNIAVSLGTIFLASLAMQPVAWLTTSLTEGRSFAGVLGAILLHFLSTLPWIVAACVLGAGAALGVVTKTPDRWAAAVALFTALVIASFQRYVAPDWVAWSAVLLHILTPAVLAWIVFCVVWEKARRATDAPTTSSAG